MSNLPTQQNPNAGALVNYEEQWKVEAQQAAAAEPPGGAPYLSVKGGILKFGEQNMPGNQVAAIVLDSWRENAYYHGRYDPEDPLPPICYAFSRSGDDMRPHESMAKHQEYFRPQANACKDCPLNEWGSADQGRGKACQNRRRLTLIPAGYYEPIRGSNDFSLHLFDDPTHFAQADAAFIRLPVTSVNEWSKYVNTVAATMFRPPHGVLTRIYVTPDAKSQYKVKFEPLLNVPDSLAPVIMQRHAAELATQAQGYEPPDTARARPEAGGYGSGNTQGLRGFQQGQQPPTQYQQMAQQPPVQSTYYDAYGNPVDQYGRPLNGPPQQPQNAPQGGGWGQQ